MTLWTLDFLAAVAVRSLDLMSAILAVKLDYGRSLRHDQDAAALRAFAFLAPVLLVNADDPATARAGEPNHGQPLHIWVDLTLSSKGVSHLPSI